MLRFDYQDVEAALKDTVFLVEATSFETHMLWAEHAEDGILHKNVKWRQHTTWVVEVGKLGGRPVCICLTWNSVNEALVCFWHATSQVVDHKMIEAWFEKNYEGKWDGGTRRATCDAWNFHHCLDVIKEKS